MRRLKKIATNTLLKVDNGNFVEFQMEPFWRKHPNLWFRRIEAHFESNEMYNDYNRYAFVVSHLDERTALEVKDYILNDPPDEPMYDSLKKQLIERVTAKNEEEAQKRMMAEDMGDRKPSEFYRYLNDLVGCYVRDHFVKGVWLICLPRQIRSVLNCLGGCELDTLMKVADRVHEVFFPLPIVQPTNTPETSALMESLVSEVESLNKKVQMLKPRGPPCRARSRGRDVQCIQPAKPQKNPPTQVTQCKPCPYHTKYGVKLCKMRKNCN